MEIQNKSNSKLSTLSNVSLISKYSLAIMGIAALMVVVSHSNMYITLPGVLKKLNPVLGMLGSYAVKMFFFISAIRLFFSMKKDDNAKHFYKKRLIRLLLPYILISVLCLTIKYFVLTVDLKAFIYDFFLFGYYINGKSTWFIASLIPMYLVFPLLFKLSNKFKNFGLVAIAIWFVIAACLQLFVPSYYDIIKNMVGGFFAFLAGLFFAPYIYDKKKLSILITAIPFLLYLVCFVVLKLQKTGAIGDTIVTMLSSTLSIMLCYIIAFVLNALPNVFTKLCDFFGKISLEIYVLGNVSHILAGFGLLKLLKAFDKTGILFYLISVIAIVILALAFSKLVEKLNALLIKKKA